MLIRLLQQFDTVELAPDEQPRSSWVPKAWSEESGKSFWDDIAGMNRNVDAKRDKIVAEMSKGWEWRKAREKISPKSHLTMYALVRKHLCKKLHILSAPGTCSPFSVIFARLMFIPLTVAWCTKSNE